MMNLCITWSAEHFLIFKGKSFLDWLNMKTYLSVIEKTQTGQLGVRSTWPNCWHYKTTPFWKITWFFNVPWDIMTLLWVAAQKRERNNISYFDYNKNHSGSVGLCSCSVSSALRGCAVTSLIFPWHSSSWTLRATRELDTEVIASIFNRTDRQRDPYRGNKSHMTITAAFSTKPVICVVQGVM